MIPKSENNTATQKKICVCVPDSDQGASILVWTPDPTRKEGSWE